MGEKDAGRGEEEEAGKGVETIGARIGEEDETEG